MTHFKDLGKKKKKSLGKLRNIDLLKQVDLLATKGQVEKLEPWELVTDLRQDLMRFN